MLTKYNRMVEPTQTQETKLGPSTQPQVLATISFLSQCLFMPHIFPNVCLMKYHNRHGVYFPAVLCGLCCHPKTQRDVCHGVHHHSLVLRSIFSDSAQSRFQHVVPIQEGLLGSRFYPHFILGIGCKVIQSCDVQPELVSLREFSKAGPQRHQLVTGDVSSQLHDLLTHIVHPVVVQPEAVGAVGPVDQQLKILPDVFCYLLKHYTGLLFGQRPHSPAGLRHEILVPQSPETEVSLQPLPGNPKACLSSCLSLVPHAGAP